MKNRKIIAYKLYGGTNDTFMFPEEDYDHCAYCKSVGFAYRRITDRPNLDMKLKIKKFDISNTYEGFVIVSENFKQFCESEKYEIEFMPLNKYPNFYVMLPRKEIIIDQENSKLLYGIMCEYCNMQDVSTNRNPVYLKNNIEIKEGIFFTDIRFGFAHAYSKSTIVGIETKKKIAEHKFKGRSFEPIYKWEE